jgi:phospholipid/cholesterol/gamma-HCH transport system substrate-binding protein
MGVVGLTIEREGRKNGAAQTIDVLVGLAVLAAGIFYVTGGESFGPKYRLITYLPDVSGLVHGAPVRLNGVEIGNVETIKLAPHVRGQVRPKNRNIEVVMRLSKQYDSDILTDSAASLSLGVTGVPLNDGQEVPGVEESGMKEVMDRSVDVLGNLQTLSEDIQGVVDGVKAGKGSVGKLLVDEQAYNHLNSILSRGEVMLANIQAGQGTLGKLVASDEMYNKVDKGLDNVNVILADVRSQKGTIGKLLYDPTLYDQAKQAISNGNAVIADVRAGKGTLGKLATDDTLYSKMKEATENVASATAKLNDNTTTVGKLFSDPRLYDNLAGLTGDMRLLIGEFRQNPKKFLRIKVAVF